MPTSDGHVHDPDPDPDPDPRPHPWWRTSPGTATKSPRKS